MKLTANYLAIVAVYSTAWGCSSSATTESTTRRALEKRRRILGEEHADAAASVEELALLEAKGDYEALATLYESWDKPEEATGWRQQLKNEE